MPTLEKTPIRCRLLGLCAAALGVWGLPEDIKAGEVPLVDAQVRAAGDVAPVELQAWL